MDSRAGAPNSTHERQGLNMETNMETNDRPADVLSAVYYELECYD